jgi:type III secretion protein F
MSDLITGTSMVYGNFDGDGAGLGNAVNWNGWLDMASGRFNAGVNDLRAKLDGALHALAGDGTPGNNGDPGNPAKLAQYQSTLTEYNLYRMAQSSTVKSLADLQKQNIRNLD